MYRTKTILTGLLSLAIICLYACANSSPEEKAKDSVKKYIIDSLKDISFKQFTIFDTITRYDSLLNVIQKLDRDSVIGNEELQKIYEQKKALDGLTSLNNIFGSGANEASISTSNENISRSIKNYKIGLDIIARNKAKILRDIKNPLMKTEVSFYSIVCDFQHENKTNSSTFFLTPNFRVVQTSN
jgi:hypothetical protein